MARVLRADAPRVPLARGVIGTRTLESQMHGQLASGLSMPTGSEDGTDGDVQVAADMPDVGDWAHVLSFSYAFHTRAAAATTAGNPDTHVILRGG